MNTLQFNNYMHKIQLDAFQTANGASWTKDLQNLFTKQS